MAKNGYAVEVETSEKTPDGAESKKSVRLSWPVVALAGVIVISVLVALGVASPDVLKLPALFK